MYITGSPIEYMWRDLWKRPLSDPKPKMGFLHNRDLRILNYVNPKFQWDPMIATLVNRHASKYYYKCHVAAPAVVWNVRRVMRHDNGARPWSQVG